MANTYHQMYIQTVFPVKYRKAVILPQWKSDLQAVLGNLINETGCKTLIVNGMEDHIHCFFGLKPSLSVSQIMKSVKAQSSKWINERGFLTHRFEWQTGYGSFSYSHSQVDAVYRYIKNQQEHHKRISFREEYLKMLDKFGVKYDKRYLFHELM